MTVFFPLAGIFPFAGFWSKDAIIDGAYVSMRGGSGVAAFVFVSGTVAAGILHSFGWPEDAIIDLGGITTARGPEMLLPLWLHLRLASDTSDFNLAVVR